MSDKKGTSPAKKGKGRKYDSPKRYPRLKISGGTPNGDKNGFNSGSDHSDHPSYRWESFLSSANSKVFNGSSPVDFNFWCQTFQMECVAAGIWDMIKPPDGTTQAMTAAMNGTVGALSAAEIVANLVEDYFTHIKPPDATYTLTRNIMDGRLEQLAEFYQDRMDWLSLNEAALSQLELNELLIGTRRDWENERFKIEQSETDILHSLASAVTHYDRLKKENAIAQAKCLKVFKNA